MPCRWPPTVVQRYPSPTSGPEPSGTSLDKQLEPEAIYPVEIGPRPNVAGHKSDARARLRLSPSPYGTK
jgi:hypothetical protein